MSLPKIDVPFFTLELPYSGLKVQFRPFTVKEEKILLFAQQSQDMRQIALAIKQVAQNCIVNDVKLEDMFTFEVDFYFVKLRAISVNNVIKLKVKDTYKEEDIFYDAELNLDEVELIKVKKTNNKIKLNDTYSIKLTFPKYGDIENVLSVLSEVNAGELTFSLIGQCIESVYSKDGEEVYMMSEYTQEERKEFLESLTTKNFKDIQDFITDIPALTHQLEYKTKDGEVKTKVLRGLFDFFSYA